MECILYISVLLGFLLYFPKTKIKVQGNCLARGETASSSVEPVFKFRIRFCSYSVHHTLLPPYLTFFNNWILISRINCGFSIW